MLHEAVREDVEFVFHDSIDVLDEHPEGVRVTFRSGAQRDFDLVIGADGLHSRTRELTFGPELPFHRYLGFCFAGFTMPNTFGLSHEIIMWNTPGRGAALYGVQDGDVVHGFLNQALVGEGDASLFPTTEEALERRNSGLRGLTGPPPATGRAEHSALPLPG